MTLNSIVLPSNGRHVLDRTRVEQRAGQEGADAVDQDGEAALDLAVDGAGDELAGLERLLERHPGGEALGLVARQDGVAVAVLDGVDRDRDEVAGLDFELALVVLEFVDRNVGFGLEAGVDDHEVVFDADDFGGDDFAGCAFRSACSDSSNMAANDSPPAGGNLSLGHADFRAARAAGWLTIRRPGVPAEWRHRREMATGPVSPVARCSRPEPACAARRAAERPASLPKLRAPRPPSLRSVRAELSRSSASSAGFEGRDGAILSRARRALPGRREDRRC